MTEFNPHPGEEFDGTSDSRRKSKGRREKENEFKKKKANKNKGRKGNGFDVEDEMQFYAHVGRSPSDSSSVADSLRGENRDEIDTIVPEVLDESASAEGTVAESLNPAPSHNPGAGFVLVNHEEPSSFRIRGDHPEIIAYRDARIEEELHAVNNNAMHIIRSGEDTVRSAPSTTETGEGTAQKARAAEASDDDERINALYNRFEDLLADYGNTLTDTQLDEFDTALKSARRNNPRDIEAMIAKLPVLFEVYSQAVREEKAATELREEKAAVVLRMIAAIDGAMWAYEGYAAKREDVREALVKHGIQMMEQLIGPAIPAESGMILARSTEQSAPVQSGLIVRPSRRHNTSGEFGLGSARRAHQAEADHNGSDSSETDPDRERADVLYAEFLRNMAAYVQGLTVEEAQRMSAGFRQQTASSINDIEHMSIDMEEFARLLQEDRLAALEMLGVLCGAVYVYEQYDQKNSAQRMRLLSSAQSMLDLLNSPVNQRRPEQVDVPVPPEPAQTPDAQPVTPAVDIPPVEEGTEPSTSEQVGRTSSGAPRDLAEVVAATETPKKPGFMASLAHSARDVSRAAAGMAAGGAALATSLTKRSSRLFRGKPSERSKLPATTVRTVNMPAFMPTSRRATMGKGARSFFVDRLVRQFRKAPAEAPITPVQAPVATPAPKSSKKKAT